MWFIQFIVTLIFRDIYFVTSSLTIIFGIIEMIILADKTVIFKLIDLNFGGKCIFLFIVLNRFLDTGTGLYFIVVNICFVDGLNIKWLIPLLFGPI